MDDFETYLINNVMSNPSYSTNTATDPNTQFQFYYSASGVALQVANLAINSSNAILARHCQRKDSTPCRPHQLSTAAC